MRDIFNASQANPSSREREQSITWFFIVKVYGRHNSLVFYTSSIPKSLASSFIVVNRHSKNAALFLAFPSAGVRRYRVVCIETRIELVVLFHFFIENFILFCMLRIFSNFAFYFCLISVCSIVL